MARPRKYEGTLQERKYKARVVWATKNYRQLNLHIDPDLYEKLQKEATRRHRSMRNYCIMKLSDGLEIVHKTKTIKNPAENDDKQA